MAIPRADSLNIGIPSSTGNQQLNADAFAGPAKSLQGIGASLDKFGQHLQIEEAKIYDAKSFAEASTASFELENNLSRTHALDPNYKQLLQAGLRDIYKPYIDAAPNKIAKQHLQARFETLQSQFVVRGLAHQKQAQVGQLALDTKATLNTLINGISTNPDQFDQNRALGLGLIQKNNIFDSLQKTQLAQQYQNDVRATELEARLNTAPQQVLHDLSSGAYDAELSPNTKQQLLHQAQKINNQENTLQSFLNDHMRGIPVQLNRSQSQIDKIYQQIESAEVGPNALAAPQQLAQMVAQFGAPYSSLDFRMQQDVLYGTESQAAQWLPVYRALKEQAPSTLANFVKNNPANKILSLAADYAQEMRLDSPERALQFAKRVQAPANKYAFDERVAQFDALKEFKGDELKPTIATMLGLKPSFWSFEANNTADLPDGQATQIRAMVKNLYVGEGIELDAAKRLVASQVSMQAGINPLLESRVWMFNPPNKVLPNGNLYDSAWLKNDFAHSLQELALASQDVANTQFKYDPMPGSSLLDRSNPDYLRKPLFGNDGRKLVIAGKPREILFDEDELTRLAPLNQLSYPLYYQDDFGIKQVLYNPYDNTPARYYPGQFQDLLHYIEQHNKAHYQQALEIIKSGNAHLGQDLQAEINQLQWRGGPYGY